MARTSDAQEYLNQVRQIDEQMRIIQSQISNIVELSGMSYDKTPTQPNGDSRTEKLAIRRLELLDKYETKKDELVKMRYEITDTIMTLKGRYQQEVLFKRYVELKRWRRVASELNLSISMAYNVHKDALQEIDKVLKHCSSLEF